MNASLSSITEPISEFFEKHHPVIFFTIVTIALALAVWFFYEASNTSDTTTNADATTAVSSTFDQETARKIQLLHQSNDPTTNLTLPASRPNPFVE